LTHPTLPSLCAQFLSAVVFGTFAIPISVQRRDAEVSAQTRVVVLVICTIFQPVSTNISERPSVGRLVDVTARTGLR
jgi:hypothetical protein